MRDLREIWSDYIADRDRKAYKSIVLSSSSLCKSNDVNYSCIGVFSVEFEQVDGLERERKSSSRAFVSV